jgi:hypothetical protein
MNIKKKFEIISWHAYWDQEKLFDEKNGDKISHGTVLLTEATKIVQALF